MKKITLIVFATAFLVISACNTKSKDNKQVQLTNTKKVKSEQLSNHNDKKNIENDIQEIPKSPKSFPNKVSKPEHKKIIKPEHLTSESFRRKVWDYKNNPQKWVFEGNLPCVIDFYADWCGPCKRVIPIMKELSEKYKGKINIYEVNTDKQRELAAVFRIRSIPSVLFCPKNGKPAMQPGALSKEMYIKIFEGFVLGKNKDKKTIN